MTAGTLPVRAQKTFTLEDGSQYLVTKYPATKGLKYQKYLLKTFGSAWVESQTKEGTTIADIISSVLENIDEIDEVLLKEMVCLAIDMQEAKFEIEFSGQTMRLFALLKEIIFYNYEDLFIVLGLGEMPEEKLPEQ